MREEGRGEKKRQEKIRPSSLRFELRATLIRSGKWKIQNPNNKAAAPIDIICAGDLASSISSQQ
eukprot:scaffold4932_cov123-Skeletonema_menzelii.AAC.3